MLPTPDRPDDQPVDGRAGDACTASSLDDIGAALAELAARPLAEHAEGYERLHADLQAALAEIDGA